MRQQRSSAMVAMLAVLWASATIWTLSSASSQESAAPPPATSDSATGQGCRLNAYSGTIPLDRRTNYVNGTQDLRGGMTCRFRINAHLPIFTFHFAGLPDNTFGGIAVAKGTSTEVIQTIESATDQGSIAPQTIENALSVVDVNFDGYKDLQILHQCGGTGNCSYNFYLYDQKTGQFVLNKFLSNLATPSFDASKRLVTSHSNSSAGDWQTETYQYKDGQYTLIRREVSDWDRAKQSITVSTYELRNGKMQRINSQTSPE